MGCTHYRRNCGLVAPCCARVYTCRLCHDDAEDHTLDRKSVQSVECAGCHLQQPVGATCRGCHLTFGTAYFCSTCRLYDNEAKQQFHCDGCGFCRVGGRENYTHCDTCQMCMAANVAHTCRADSARNACPLCYEDIFTSRIAAHIPPCGHMLHQTCYQDMCRKGYFSCPLCGKCMQNMRPLWERLDAEIADTPMPLPYQKLFRSILCKDCSVLSTAPFHVVGMKCSACGGYNTSIEGPLQKQITITEEVEGEEKVVRTEFQTLTETELEALASRPPLGTEGQAGDRPGTEEGEANEEEYDTVDEEDGDEDDDEDDDNDDEGIEDTEEDEEEHVPSSEHPPPDIGLD